MRTHFRPAVGRPARGGGTSRVVAVRIVLVPVAALGAAALILGGLLRAGWVSPQPVSPFELLSLVVAVAGAAVLIPTLMSLARQTRAMKDQSEFLAIQVFADNLLELDRVFVDRPQLRPYFYGGADLADLDEPARQRVLAVAELKLDVLEFLTGVGGDYAMDHMGSLRAYAVRSFAQSPVLCDVLREAREEYGPALFALMDEGLARRTAGTARPQRP